MTEREVNGRRNWKAEVFPYDHYIQPDSHECQYCLTDLQAEILRGIIEPLGWETRWWSETTGISKDEIQAFRDDITRRLMMGCCGDEGNTIFIWLSDGTLVIEDPETGEQTPAPQFDPRNTSTRFPPIEGEDGDDKKCAAAASMKALIKEQVGDNLTDDMGRYTLTQLITDWVNTMLQTSNIFEALITVAANQIFALVIATLRPALTDEVYDNLQCIFYCNMSDDASFTQEQVDQVRSDITSQIGGIAGIFFEHLVFLLGVAGMSNLARSGAIASSDCSDCDCGDNVCGDDWIDYNTITHGHIIGFDPDTGVLTVQSTSDDMAFWSNDASGMTCCKIVGVEVVSGGGRNGEGASLIACGQERVVGNFVFSASLFGACTCGVSLPVHHPTTLAFSFQVC